MVVKQNCNEVFSSAEAISEMMESKNSDAETKRLLFLEVFFVDMMTAIEKLQGRLSNLTEEEAEAE